MLNIDTYIQLILKPRNMPFYGNRKGGGGGGGCALPHHPLMHTPTNLFTHV